MPAPLTVVYVLVQAGDKPYARMTELSARAVRRLHPDARLVLVTDPDSRPAIATAAPRLLGLIDEHVVEPAPMPGGKAKGFHLKSRFRELVAGDLVYLDADTLPVRPFAGPFADPGWELAAVQDRNHHCPVAPAGYPFWEEHRLKRDGWTDVPMPRYFNTGVLFLRDTPAVRAVAADWQRFYRQSLAAGDDWDQLAFNYALCRHPGAAVRELPPAYNAMLTVHPVHARQARVYHLFAGSPGAWDGMLYPHLLDHLGRTGEVDWAALDRCVAIDHPWLPPYWPRRLWQTGNRGRAVREYVRRLAGRRT